MSKITKIQTNKDYAVVLSTEFNSYSEIPTNWLLYEEIFKDKIACHWPGARVKNITQKIKNREPPAKDWTIQEIQILRSCTKLDTCIYLLGKLMTEAKDLKQRSASNNNGNSGLDSAISAEIESHLRLDTREEV